MSRDLSQMEALLPDTEARGRPGEYTLALEGRVWSALGRVSTEAFERMQKGIGRIAAEASRGEHGDGLVRIDLDHEFVALVEVQSTPRNVVIVRDLLRAIPGGSNE